MAKEPGNKTSSRAQQRRFSHPLLDNLLEGCQIISPDWRYLYLNDSAVIQGRKRREDLIGKSMMEVYPGIEHTPLFSVLKKCMDEGTPGRIENELSFSDGSRGWFALRLERVPAGVFVLSLDITEQRRAGEEQRLMFEVLQLINSAENKEVLLRSVLSHLHKWSGCEAVGIRLKEGPDFPYFATSGFPEQFVEMENHLCSYDEEGELLRDAEGNPAVDCMCGNILCERFDPSKSFFTADGSFWSNCTTKLLATTTEADRQARTRNRCNSSGYESVALIPLRSGSETFGLLQFNDKRKGRFTPELIALFRRIADNIANFLARKQAEVRIVHLNAVLRGIRNVNQLITREKDRVRLIQKTCDLLVEDRGFYSAIVGLTDGSDGRVSAYAGAGQKLLHLRHIFDTGNAPQCVHQAMKQRETVLKRNIEWSCKGCDGAAPSGINQDSLIICLEQEGVPYGFMITCLPGGMGDDLEEQELLREVAEDLTFALRNIEIETQRDRSTVDLANTKEQLRQAQKLEAVGQLAGGIAHDFNNLLTVQIGYCDIMKRGLRDEDPFARGLAQIRAAADRAAALTRQLLAFSRKQTLQPKILDLNSVIMNIEKMLRRLIGEDIDFILAFGNNLGTVEADPGQIEQVIMNLAVNARDAMPQGGKLIIETANVDLDEGYARSHVGVKAGPYVMLAITDTGCGMDQATKARLFEPFFTTKEQKGTGLGLAMAYGIIKQSRGNIWAYSELGKGTTFKIYLPLIEAEPAQHVCQKTEPLRGQGEMILVVEDEMDLRWFFAEIIEHLGYQARVASNGREALEVVKKQGLRPDLLITDVVMPGMSGKMLATRLTKIQPDLKVLYVSGYTDNAIVHHGVLDPQTPFLQKPFSVDGLGAKIHEVLTSIQPPKTAKRR